MNRLDLIELTVTEHMGVEPGFLANIGRDKATSDARTMLWGLCRDLTQLSARKIAEHFHKHFKTIYIGAERHCDLCQIDRAYAAKAEAIKDQILNGVAV